MAIKIPNQQYSQQVTQLNSWSQSNNSDTNGTLWASKNIDLTENESKLRLGKRLVLNTATADNADLSAPPIGFKLMNVVYTVAGSYVHSMFGNYPNSAGFTKVTASGAPSTCDSQYSDIEVSNGYMYVSANDAKVYYMDSGGTWGSFSAGSAYTTHMLTSYGGRTYMSNLYSSIVSWSTSNGSDLATSGQYTLQMGNSNSNVITCLRSSSNRIWICTVNNLGGKGYVYEWDGASNQATKSYRLESSGAVSCVIKDDIPYIMDTYGNLLSWNGSTFKKLDGFNRITNQLFIDLASYSNTRFIHPNGMSIVKGKINLLINGTSADAVGSTVQTIPSGIWEYDEKHGLYHKYSFTLDKSGGTIKDYGASKISRVGALAELNFANTDTGRDGTLFAGTNYYTDASTVTTGIFYDNSLDNLQKGGNFITGKIYSPNVMETFQSLYYRYKRLASSNDKIVVKYRTDDVEPVEGTITWTSTTTFTVPNSSVVVSNYWTSGTGGEVEIIQGVGSGKCSHITNAVLSAGTWTVTVDETYTGATGTAIARFQNWTKLGSNVYGDNHTAFNNLQFPLLSTATWVQIKVWMLFTGRQEIDDLQLQTKGSQTANK